MPNGTMKILSCERIQEQKEKEDYDEANFVPIGFFFVANSCVCIFLLSKWLFMKQHCSMNE
jgi:hypothetical protein